MVHPTELIRSPSDVAQFTAPVGNVHSDQPDCGLNLLPWLTTRLKLERYNRNTVFVTFLAVLTLLHACATSYFVGTARVWRVNYHMSEVLAEWVVYLNPIFGGLFALLLSHYGNIIHRPCYIGGLAMLHAVAGWVLLLPEFFHPGYEYLNTTTAVSQQTLCMRPPTNASGASIMHYEQELEYDEGKKYIALAIMAFYQLLHGLAFVSMVSHGISYIDDGCQKYQTPTFICFIVAIAQIGRFIGLNMTLIPVAFNRHIFFSFAWLTTMTGIFIFGFLLSLFSKLPQRLLVRNGVNTLLRRQSTIDTRSPSNNPPTTEETKHLGFCETLSSLFTSNQLLLNTLAATFMHVAIINFNAMREEFFRSRFVNFADDFDYKFSFYNVSSLIFMCLIIVAMAVMFLHRRPSTKFCVVWLIVCYVAIMGFFASYAFLKCEDQTTLFQYRQTVEGCNAFCGCKVDVFEPVCLEGKTYYSACFAGCTGKDNGGYHTCECGIDSKLASSGSCNQNKCEVVAFFAEANSVISFALLVSAYIVHVIISLRAVEHHQLRSSGIGLLLLGVHLLPYVPFKFIYEVIKTTHCAHSHDSECFIFTKHFALTISLVTVGFMLTSIIIACCMLCGAGNVDLYKRRGSRQLGMSSMRLNDRIPTVVQEEEEDAEELHDDSCLREEEAEHMLGHPSRNLNHTQKTNLRKNDDSDDELEEERLRKTDHHNDVLRKSLHQVIASAARVSPNGSVYEPNASSKEHTPRLPVRPPMLQKQNNVSDRYSSFDSLTSHDDLEDKDHASRKQAPHIDTDSDANRLGLESEGFNDSDIDSELARLEREEPPKCLKRGSSFDETNF